MEVRSGSSWQEAKGAKGRRRSTGEQAANDLFVRLDPSNVGFIYESQMRPIWAALARHVQEGSAAVFLRQLQERTSPISRGEWTLIMDALESIVGIRLFRTLMRGAETLLAELECSSMQMRSRNQVEAIEWNVSSRRSKRKEEDFQAKVQASEELPKEEEAAKLQAAGVKKSVPSESAPPKEQRQADQPAPGKVDKTASTKAAEDAAGPEKKTDASNAAKPATQEAAVAQAPKWQPKFKAEPKSNTGPKQRRPQPPAQASAQKEKEAPKGDVKPKPTCRDASTNTEPLSEGRLASNQVQASNTGPKQSRRGKGELTKAIAQEAGPPSRSSSKLQAGGDQAGGTGSDKGSSVETPAPAKPKAPPPLSPAPPAAPQAKRQQISPLSRSQSEPWLPSTETVLKEQEVVKEPVASSLPIIPQRHARVNDPGLKKKPANSAKEKDTMEASRRNSSSSIVQVPKEKRGSYQELRVKLDEGRKELTKQRQQVKDLERLLQEASRRDKPHYGITQVAAYRTPVVPEPQERHPVRKLVVLPRLGHGGGYPDSSVSELSLAKLGAASAPANADQNELEPRTRDQSPEERERLALAAREDNKVVAMSRRERSRARTQAIIELGSEGQDTWDLRKAEKASRLVDLHTFSEAMWGSFFEWKADLEIDIT